MHRTWIWRSLGAAALCASGLLHAGEPLTFSASARVEVDAQGSVTKVEPSPGLTPALHELVRSQVASYRFESPLDGGRPAPGVTYVKLGGCALPDSKGPGYKVSMAFHSAGPRLVGDQLLPPRYPPDAFQNGYEAAATVVYIVRPDGVPEVEKIRYRGKQRGKALFDRELAQWMSQFRYEPEIIGGRAVSTRFEVPVTFSLGDVESESTLRKREVARRMSTAECTAAASSGALEPVALETRFKRVPAG
jgi:TonB family protein